MRRYIVAMVMVIGMSNVSAVHAGAEIVLVVNKSNPVNTLTKARVRSMILGAVKKWPTGDAVSVITTSPGDAERKSALLTYAGMSEQQFATAFLQANFKGEDRTPPKTLPNGKIIVQIVALTPGAIGFVDSADLSPMVKRVAVE